LAKLAFHHRSLAKKLLFGEIESLFGEMESLFIEEMAKKWQ
jgi:hypothetical protein